MVGSWTGASAAQPASNNVNKIAAKRMKNHPRLKRGCCIATVAEW
jgi:hypothetical protein